jgi:16S rRNA (cytidine1402-2'-O)-methyltransferase
VPLVLAATPIGNAADASARLRDALASADVVAAEDTRRLRKLMSTLGVTPAGRIVSLYDANEQARIEPLLALLREGQTVLVVSDAGTPLVSDPGYRLVAAAAEAGVAVTALPGPSAVTAALSVSGLATDRWTFEGFLPRKAGERQRRIAELATERRTMVFFEAPHRAEAMLRDLADGFGQDRRAALCRELTKTHEEVRRESLAELAEWATGEVRGEITLVVAGAEEQPAEVSDEAIAAAVRAKLIEGLTKRDASAAVARELGLARRAVYAIATTVSARADEASQRRSR